MIQAPIVFVVFKENYFDWATCFQFFSNVRKVVKRAHFPSNQTTFFFDASILNPAQFSKEKLNIALVYYDLKLFSFWSYIDFENWARYPVSTLVRFCNIELIILAHIFLYVCFVFLFANWPFINKFNIFLATNNPLYFFQEST